MIFKGRRQNSPQYNDKNNWVNKHDAKVTNRVTDPLDGSIDFYKKFV